MRITQKPSGVLGRRLHFPAAYFNIDSICFSDESISSDIIYAERIKIIRYKNGLMIKAFSCDGRHFVEMQYSELAKIRVTQPDVYDMPKQERGGLSTVFFSWAQGLSSLHDIKMKIGRSIEFVYKKNGSEHDITIYHGKQDIFDMFKYVRRHFGKYIL